mgnify:CR=1 FL=1
MNYKIDAVMIDTSIYHKNRCDFEGITRSIIPMLLQLLEANNITLLTHPVLESEIRKHIGESELVSKLRNFQTSIKKYNIEGCLFHVVLSFLLHSQFGIKAISPPILTI